LRRKDFNAWVLNCEAGQSQSGLRVNIRWVKFEGFVKTLYGPTVVPSLHKKPSDRNLFLDFSLARVGGGTPS
jgi:hypothetical protein